MNRRTEDFEAELKQALRRAEPSPDFTARVLARIAALPRIAPPQPSPSWRQRLAALFVFPQLRPLAVGALACVLVAAGVGVHRYREYQRMKAEGETAGAQVVLALQIASAKLNAAQRKVQKGIDRKQ